MESTINYICEHADYAHYIIFGLILLTGFNIPISEDLLVIMGGTIASTCIPEHTLRIYLWIYAASWTSAWEAYWIGRLFGPRLYEIRWFSRILTPKRIEKLHFYYEKFGIFTFIIGRFFPGGVRNALFISSGLGKMPFLKFISRDGFACIVSTGLLFSLGYIFGQNYKLIIHYIKTYDLIILTIISLILIIYGMYRLIKFKKKG